MAISQSIVGGERYRDRVLRDGTVGYWRLGDAVGSGTAADTSGLGRVGTVFGGVTFGQAGPIADGDTAALFAAGYITASITPLGASYSIEAWIKYTSSAFADIAEAAGAQFYVNSGYLNFWMPPTNCSAGRYYDGQWHHVVATYDGANMRLYVDGALGGGPTAKVGSMNGAVFNIGRYAGEGYYWDGSIDEVAIYPAALTAEQIAAHYGLRLAAVHGGLLIGGAAGITRGVSMIASGGLLIGGAAGITRGVRVAGTGGLLMGGEGWPWTTPRGRLIAGTASARTHDLLASTRTHTLTASVE